MDVNEEVWQKVEDLIAGRLSRSIPASEVVQCLAVMPSSRREAWFSAWRAKDRKEEEQPIPLSLEEILQKRRKGEPAWMSSAPDQAR